MLGEMMNEFATDLAYSEAMSSDEFWEAIYRKAFPDMVGQLPVTGDNQAQRLGIDRLIVLASGRVLRVDEKKRRMVRNDILLEVVSVDTKNAPGWIEKDLAIDYLAYAFMPTKTCYLFPWDFLRSAWLRHGRDWRAAYGTVAAQNPGYRTISVPVPIKDLRRAVANAGVVQL